MLKKNLFFVIFGMLALCAMLAMACNGGGGEGGGNNDPPADKPTPQQLADAAIGSMSGLKVSAGTANAYGDLSFTLTGGKNEVSGATFEMSGLKVAGSTGTTIPLTYSSGAFTLAFPTSAFVAAEAASISTGNVVTFDIKAKQGGSTSTDSKSIAIPAASIASVTPAILALRQVKTELAKAGSATIAGETSAGSVGTITVDTGSISLAYGDSASIILTGGTYTEVSKTFESSLMQEGDIAIGTLTSNVLSITDAGYGGTAGTTLATGSVGTYTAAGTFTYEGSTATGSYSTPFLPIEYGSVSASFNNIVLTAEGLKYTAPVFTITVHTTRKGDDYPVLVGTTSP